MKRLLKKFIGLPLKAKLLLTAVLAIALIFLFGIISKAFTPPPYTLGKVIRSNVTEVVSETGKITTESEIRTYSPSNGMVSNIFVNNGQKVIEGDALFSVKSTASFQEQQALLAEYLSAKEILNTSIANENILRAEMYQSWKSFIDLATNSTYENADKSPNVDKRSSAEFQISQDLWTAAEKKYKDQQVSIAKAQALVNSSWMTYEATQDSLVKAPITGKISNLSVVLGNSVRVNSATNPQLPILIISSPTTKEVLLKIGESDINKIKPGQKATIDVTAVNNKKYLGEVTRTDEIGTDEQGVVTYNAYIKLLNADENLKSGMTVDVEISTNELKNVLTVPNSAVKPYQGGRGIRIPGNKKGEIKFIPIVIGVRGKNRTQILEGLREGQEIIIALSNDSLKRSGLFGL